MLLFTSCYKKDYHCIVKYEVNYPDTTWVHTYEFEGNKYAKAVLVKNFYGRLELDVYEYRCSSGYEIATVPDENCSIKILDYKMYKQKHDINIVE